MALYMKKLYIKKPNGVIQTANLYTDKSDVGANYLTLKSGNDTIYSMLDINGDVDCKISKNNVSYKIKKENVINIPDFHTYINTPTTFTVPNGVKVIYLYSDEQINDFKNGWQRISSYVKVTPNKTYNVLFGLYEFANFLIHARERLIQVRFGNFYRAINQYGVTVNESMRIASKIHIYASTAINNHTVDGSAD